MIGDFNREALGIEVDFLLPLERVIRSLEKSSPGVDALGVIRYDNGPASISAALQNWGSRRSVRLEYIQPDTRGASIS